MDLIKSNYVLLSLSLYVIYILCTNKFITYLSDLKLCRVRILFILETIFVYGKR